MYQQKPYQKPSRWRYLFIILVVLQIVGVSLFFYIMADAVQMAKDGVSGTEFIGMLVYFTLVPAVGCVALVNLIGLPIYMVKRRPRAVGLTVSILSLLFSLGLFLFAGYVVYQTRFVS